MFISRIPLNAARYDAQQLIASPYKLHAAVEHSFPPTAVRADKSGRILWRLDMNAHDPHSVWLYVVSPQKPDFTHIVEQTGWPLYGEWESKDYSILLNRLAKGQQWRFRLRANPVRKATRDYGLKPREGIVGKIQGYVTVPQQTQWLVDRAEEHGFQILESDSIPQVVISQRQKQRFMRKDATVSLSTALFDGALEVTDAEAFRKTLCFGMGRAKGFGCGLLTIAPLHAMEADNNER
jgi:CRISPR system Cascade subunit CasE